MVLLVWRGLVSGEDVDCSTLASVGDASVCSSSLLAGSSVSFSSCSLFMLSGMSSRMWRV